MSNSRPKIGVSTLERAANRDPDAWRALYRVVFPAVSFVLGKQHNDVEDVAQEALCKILSWIVREGYKQSYFFSTTDDDASVERWVKAIARHAAIDHLRRTKRSSTLLSFDEMAMILPPRDPLNTIFVRKAMSQMPEEQRAVFILYYVEGLTQQEICERLGIPIGTVKSRIHRTNAQMHTAGSIDPPDDDTDETQGNHMRTSHSQIREIVRDEDHNTSLTNIGRGASARKSEGRK